MWPSKQVPWALSGPRREVYGEIENWKSQGRGREEKRKEKERAGEKNRKCGKSERKEKNLRGKKGMGRRTPQKTTQRRQAVERGFLPPRPLGEASLPTVDSAAQGCPLLTLRCPQGPEPEDSHSSGQAVPACVQVCSVPAQPVCVQPGLVLQIAWHLFPGCV